MKGYWAGCAALLCAVLLAGCSAEKRPVTLEEMEEAAPVSYVGTWQLDGQRTNESLTAYASLQEMFGTGLSTYGASMEINEDHSFSYYIGAGIGGEGQWELEENTLRALVTPYMEEGESQLLLTPATEEEETFLTMDFDGETLYWSCEK